MDSRAVKTIMLFLQGPCKGAAFVVNDAEDADVDFFDADTFGSKKLLEKHLQTKLLRPTVVLSLHEYVHKGILHLTKPIKTSDMLAVLEQTKTLANELSKKAAEPALVTPSDTAEKDDFDLFNDELFDYISSSSWDEPVAPQAAAEILRVVTVSQKAEEPAPAVTNLDNDHKLSENQGEMPSPPSPETQPVGNETEAGTSNSESEISTLPVSETEVIADEMADETEKQELKTYVGNLERNKISKHQTSMRLDENGYHDYIGEIEEIDNNDPKHFDKAQYNPNDYLQGTVWSAYLECTAKGQIMSLASDWLHATLFPNTKELWLGANDIETKGFAGIKLKRKTTTETPLLTTVDPNTIDKEYALDKYQNIEAFMWKLACWTSKGRYPDDIDYRLPVYLSHWPNFTRLLITPHALKIAALLIQGPRTMGNIAQMLKIKPQYVFVFISAAHAIGLANQAKRVADSLVQPPDVKPNKAKGLLSKIMSKLRY